MSKTVFSSPASRNFIIVSSWNNKIISFQWEQLLQLLKQKSNSCDQFGTQYITAIKQLKNMSKTVFSSPTSRNFIIVSSWNSKVIFFQWEQLLQLLKQKSNSCDQFGTQYITAIKKLQNMSKTVFSSPTLRNFMRRFENN